MTADRRFDHVAVLKGGPSEEREVSLRSGAAVAAGLAEAGYRVSEIDVRGDDFQLPDGVEAVFIALHGAFGEDGQAQEALHRLGVPYTGTKASEMPLSFDKRSTKQILEREKLPTPDFELLRAGSERSLALPVVIKPPEQGSSVGISIVFNESDWPEAAREAFSFSEELLIEAYVGGGELTVGIVGEDALPAIEIRVPDGYYDYASKYTRGDTEYLVPAPISAAAAEECRELALRTFHALGCRDLARIDFRMTDEEELFILECNSIPGFTETSLLPKAARARGIGFADLCSLIMERASLE